MAAAGVKLIGTGISALTECFELYAEVKGSTRPLSVTEKLNVAMKGVFLGLQVRSLREQAGAARPDTLRDYKAAEFAASVVHLSTDVAAKLGGDKPTSKQFESFLGNAAKTMRLAAEVDFYDEKDCLEEIEVGATDEIIECKKAISDASKTISYCMVAEIIAKTQAATFAVEQVEAYLDYVLSAQGEHAARMAADPADLRLRQTIPEAFEDDEVFSQYICPILLLPIRYPVRDPRTQHLYEAHALMGWVEQHQTSPMSRLPLRPDEVEKVPEVQRIIEARMAELQIFEDDSSSEDN